MQHNSECDGIMEVGMQAYKHSWNTNLTFQRLCESIKK